MGEHHWRNEREELLTAAHRDGALEYLRVETLLSWILQDKLALLRHSGGRRQTPRTERTHTQELWGEHTGQFRKL